MGCDDYTPILPHWTGPEWVEVRSGLGADSNKQQLRGKRQICDNLLLYESDVMQGGGYVVSISLVLFLCMSHLYPLLPHLQRWAGIIYMVIFTFQSPDIGHALWGQADGNNPTLSPALQYRKSQRGRCPNVITSALPRHCGDNQKVLALHHSLAIPQMAPRPEVTCFT